MGFSLKRTVNKATNVGKGLLGNVSGALFGRPGQQNPYSPVDFSQLMNFDVEGVGGPKVPLTQRFRAFQAPTASFDRLVSNIGAPSSVDAVRREVESDRMNQLLGDIDIDTNRALGDTRLDFLDRGLGGPGAASDIEAIGLAQVRGDAGRRRAGVRSEFAGKELDRVAAKEGALRDAYKGAYELDARGALQDQSIFNSLLGQEGNMEENARQRALQKLLGLTGAQAGAYQNAQNNLQPRQPGFFDTLWTKASDKWTDKLSDPDTLMAMFGAPPGAGAAAGGGGAPMNFMSSSGRLPTSKLGLY